jgi:hypothetical protein
VDLESIKSIWESWKEVQEKKALDPVGKADGDIDNDGDEDSSDEYLANRRKKIGKEIAKDDVKEEDDSEEDDSEEDSEDDEKKSKKPKKGVNPFAKKKDDEDDEDEDDVKEAKEYSYTVVHAKKGKVVVKAPTSYDAAQKAAKQWKLKSTAGVDSYIMEDTDVKMPEWLQVIGEKLKAMEESDDPVADEEEAYKDDKKPSKGMKKDAKKDDEEESENGEPTTEKMKGMRKEDFASEADWRVASMREALAVMEANKQTQGATKSEPYDDTASQGSKDFIKMHKKSNPDLEDLEDNKAVLPTGVKSQSPSRRGDNPDNGDGKKPKK